MISLLARSAAPPVRSLQLELLELGEGSEEEVRANLLEMARYNRLLGGLVPLKRHIWPAIEAAARAGRTARVLEAGCGSASLSSWLARKARRAGVRAEFFALDLAQRNLVIRPDDVSLLAGDMLSAPFADQAFDAAFSTLTLHHLDPPTLIRAMRELARLTKGPVALHDLVRGRTSEVLFRLTAPVMARSRMAHHDGLLSIQRSYTVAELRAMAAEAGFPAACVEEHWPWRRMTAVIRP